MKKVVVALSVSAFVVFGAVQATAAPYIVNVSLANIPTAFDAVIAATGSSVVTAPVVSGQNVYNYIDIDGNPATVTVTRPAGANALPSGGYSHGGVSLSGSVWDISPSPSGGPIPGWNSGLTFTFSSPVNAFGFEVGDWATCCMSGTRPLAVQQQYGVPAGGSGLWIAFDGGAATLPANALTATDNPGYPPSFTNFIGAIDDSGFFSSVTFFGDGFGEYLVVGGTLRFASVPEGSVTQPGVPEPALFGLLALGALAALRRRS
jgi:MYXO-CTERM domain-containing protein